MDIPATVALILAALGAVAYIGGFNRIGPIDTPKGMKRLAYCLFAAAFIVGISQSTRTQSTPTSAMEQP